MFYLKIKKELKFVQCKRNKIEIIQLGILSMSYILIKQKIKNVICFKFIDLKRNSKKASFYSKLNLMIFLRIF